MNSAFKALIICSMIITSGCSTLKKTKVLLPASWLSMVRIGDNIYVDVSMPEEQRKQLLAKVNPAKERVEKIWGRVISSPEIYACSTNICYKNLGGGARAHQIFNNIVLSPKALSIEMISHEWSHAELAKRVDDFFRLSEIPSWFDEGIAVIVSNDPRNNEAAWNKILNKNLPYPEMNELETLSNWNKAVGKYQKNVDINEIIVIYTTAGHVVNQWYKNNKSKALVSLLEKVKEGGSFSELYENIQ